MSENAGQAENEENEAPEKVLTETGDCQTQPCRQISTVDMSHLRPNSVYRKSTTGNKLDFELTKQTLVATAQHPMTIRKKLKKAFKVKTKFIPAKATYFLFFAARSVFQANFMIFLTALGLDPKQAGILQGIRLFLFTLSAFLWGYLSDRYGRQQLIFSIQIVAGTAFALAMPLVPLFWRNIASKCNAVHFITDSLNATQVLINMTANSTVESIIVPPKDPLYKTASTQVFLLMLALGCGSAFFGGGTQVLIDTVILTFTKKSSKSKNAFGRQRLWGSVSNAVCPVIVGAITDAVNFEPSIFLPAFTVFSFLNLSLLLSYILLAQTANVSTASTYSFKDVKQQAFSWKSLNQSKVIVYLLVVFVLGFANGIQWNFILIMTKEIGATKTFMGLLVFTQCFVEIIVLPSASKVREIFGGRNFAMVAGVFGYGVAFTVLHAVRDARLVLIVSAIIGLSFATFYTAAMDELYSLCSKNNVTTFLGIYSALYTGVGSALASIIGGTVYEAYGAKTLFLSAACLQYIFGVLLVIWYAIDRYRNGNPQLSVHEIKEESKKQISEVIYSDIISVSIMSISIVELKALENAAMNVGQDEVSSDENSSHA